MPSFSTRRVVIWTIVVLLVSCRYWKTLVESLDGSLYKAVLIVVLAWTCGCIDVNEMVGQPHED